MSSNSLLASFRRFSSSTFLTLNKSLAAPLATPLATLLAIPLATPSFHHHARHFSINSSVNGSVNSSVNMVSAPSGMFPAPIADVAFIWNFFPRPAMNGDLMGFVRFWAGGYKRINDYHKDDKRNISTHLSMSCCADSKFEFINFGILKDFDALPFMTIKDPAAFMRIMGIKPGDPPPPVKAFPGGYKEIQGFSKTPKPASLPKARSLGTVFIIASFAFEADIPRGPPPPPSPGTPPTPPGFHPVTNEAIEKTKTDLEADWVVKTGADLLARQEIVNDIYFYRRHTHGLHAFVVRAECAISNGDAAAVAAKATDAAEELKAHLAGSEFLKGGGLAFDVTVLNLVVNTDGPTILDNQFGVN